MAPPPELVGHVSRMEAANLLGYPSVYRVRQLEREGRLQVARGAMGSAWYPRQEVLALRDRERVAVAAPAGMEAPRASARRRTDAELIAYLRGAVTTFTTVTTVLGRPPTVADLVADTGVSIARAQKVYRFWLAHDQHPTAQQARTGRPAPAASRSSDAPRAAPAAPAPLERRSPGRLQHGALIRQLRAADPAQRAAAFAALKNARPPADSR